MTLFPVCSAADVIAMQEMVSRFTARRRSLYSNLTLRRHPSGCRLAAGRIHPRRHCPHPRGAGVRAARRARLNRAGGRAAHGGASACAPPRAQPRSTHEGRDAGKCRPAHHSEYARAGEAVSAMKQAGNRSARQVTLHLTLPILVTLTAGWHSPPAVPFS